MDLSFTLTIPVIWHFSFAVIVVFAGFFLIVWSWKLVTSLLVGG